MLVDAVDDVAQVRLGIDPIEFCGADQALDRRGALAARVGAREQEILAAQSHAAKRPLSGVVINFDSSVIDESGERYPARQRIANGHGKLRLLRHASESLLEPSFKLMH
jgi:hypothetical protein